MLIRPNDDDLERALCGAAKAWERTMREQLQDESINFRQYQVLCHLATAGSLTQGELAERMCITPSSLVMIIDRLEEQKLVARHDCRNDRRSKRLVLLEGAREVWQRVSGLAAEVDQQAKTQLTSEQVEQLQCALTIVLGSLGMQQPSNTKVAT
jgi:MarR family transcriptional regulator for hemolysin